MATFTSFLTGLQTCYRGLRAQNESHLLMILGNWKFPKINIGLKSESYVCHFLLEVPCKLWHVAEDRVDTPRVGSVLVTLHK